MHTMGAIQLTLQSYTIHPLLECPTLSPQEQCTTDSGWVKPVVTTAETISTWWGHSDFEEEIKTIFC